MIAPIVYLALVGCYCGLEIDTFVSDLPYLQASTLVLFCNVLFVLLIPPLLYSFFKKPFIVILNTLYFLVAAFLALYKSVRRIDFDFNFFWYNAGEALPVLWKIYGLWLAAIAIGMIAFAFFQKPAFSPLRKMRFVLGALVFSSVLCQAITLAKVRGSAAGFLYASFLSDRQLREEYRALYRNHVKALRSEPPIPLGEGHPSTMGDVIFFVKQESLNGLLTRPSITPRLLNIARDGILFRDFYANSIQSIRGYECILCGVPPNIGEALVDEYPPNALKDLSCLPKVFKSLGYHPLYFFAGSRNPRFMRFAQSIGFEKVLADDIMHPGDVKFDWGYREDVFYSRVYEYLRQHHANDKLFVFIDTGATNHTPFEVLDEKYLDKVPYPRPETFEQHLSNTTFVQDAYLGYFYELFKKYYASRGSLLVASDHAWPIPLHKNNIYNERGAFEENFRIPLVFVPPSEKRAQFAIGSAVTQRFSQMDIFPTVLNLIGLEQRRLLGESFAPWLLASNKKMRRDPQRTKISVQPYGGGFISVVRYPEKYLFDVLGKSYSVFDLEKDPGESSPSLHLDGAPISLINNFFLVEARRAVSE